MGFKAGVAIRGLLITMAMFFFIFATLLSAGCGTGGTGPAEGGPGASTGPGHEIPLNTLSQGVNSEYGRFDEMPLPEDAPPECMVITDGEEYQRLMSLAFPQGKAAEVDFDRYIVMAAMQEPKKTGGYAISIMRVSQAGMEVRVEVDVVEPEPGSMTVQMLTSPYHLVTAERSSFNPRGELIFTFIDQNDTSLGRQGADV